MTTLPPFGAKPFALLNRYGLWTLYTKEVRRFLKVYSQTLLAPCITTLLYLAVFVVALGGSGRRLLGVPFPDFIAPGLIIMAMLQNSFANTSSSIIIGKVQGSIIDVLMPPLSPGELMAAYVGGAVTRALMVGFVVCIAVLLLPGVDLHIHNIGIILFFGIMGSALLALMGVLTGLWAEKFDHAAAITNFIVQPLSMLSGTFYTLDRLPGTWAKVSVFNPFFHIIDGFRSGFIGAADAPLMPGAITLTVINILLWLLCVHLLRTGWRTRP
jgi:ABC-2 type transport system permease protein